MITTKTACRQDDNALIIKHNIAPKHFVVEEESRDEWWAQQLIWMAAGCEVPFASHSGSKVEMTFMNVKWSAQCLEHGNSKYCHFGYFLVNWKTYPSQFQITFASLFLSFGVLDGHSWFSDVLKILLVPYPLCSFHPTEKVKSRHGIRSVSSSIFFWEHMT